MIENVLRSSWFELVTIVGGLLTLATGIVTLVGYLKRVAPYWKALREQAKVVYAHVDPPVPPRPTKKPTDREQLRAKVIVGLWPMIFLAGMFMVSFGAILARLTQVHTGYRWLFALAVMKGSSDTVLYSYAFSQMVLGAVICRRSEKALGAAFRKLPRPRDTNYPLTPLDAYLGRNW